MFDEPKMVLEQALAEAVGYLRTDSDLNPEGLMTENEIRLMMTKLLPVNSERSLQVQSQAKR
jgi:hypothetical protein